LNAFSFHISPYDLVFLGVIFTGLNFAWLLVFNKRTGRSANRCLALALVATALWIVNTSAFDVLLPVQFSLAIGPLIYFYVLHLTKPESKFNWKDLLHFITVLAGAVNLPGIATLCLTAVSVVSYLYFANRLIERFYRRQRFNGGDRYRYELLWLQRSLRAFDLLWLLWISYALAGYFCYHNWLNLQAHYPFYLGAAIIITWIGISAYLRPEAALPVPALPVAKLPLPSALKEKGLWLKKTLEANSFYKDPELTLNVLAEKLELTTHELSRIINTALKKNFHEFISEYRVADVVQKMQDPAYDHITLLGIAYDSGFNSKSTFNRIFKENTGLSPAEYKTGLKKEFPVYKPGRFPQLATIISGNETTPKWSHEESNRNFMFKNNLKIAWRNFIKDRRFALLNLLGLATGIACTLLIYLWVHDEMSVDKFFAHNDQIYQIMERSKADGDATISDESTGLISDILPLRAPEIKYAASVAPADWFQKFTLSAGDKNIKASGQYAGKDYFNIFSYNLLDGKRDKVLADKSSIVISDELAKNLFGTTQNLAGKVIHFQHQQDFFVSGVFERTGRNSSQQFDFVLSFEYLFSVQGWVKSWNNTGPHNFVLLKEGTDVKAFNKKIAGVITEFNKTSTRTPVAVKFSDNYLLNTFSHGSKTGSKMVYVRLFSLIALFILIIACINFMNLSTAKASSRMKEVGIKKVIGAERSQLIVQFLSESMLMAVISTLLAVGLAWLLLPQFNGITGKQLTLNLGPQLILALAGISIFTGLLSGSYPALYLSKFNPLAVLKSKVNTSFGAMISRKGLVVFQFTLSVILIVSVLVVYRQVKFIQSADPGYNKDNIVRFDSDGLIQGKQDIFVDRLKTLPGVVNASFTFNNMIGRNFGTTGIDWDGKNPNDNIYFEGFGGGYDFVETMGMHMVQGRSFSRKYGADDSALLVNEAAVAVCISKTQWAKISGNTVTIRASSEW